MVTCPLIVDKESGFNDMLDRDGFRTPVEFKCGLGLDNQLMHRYRSSCNQVEVLGFKTI